MARRSCSHSNARQPSHNLPSFARYLSKVFDFRSQAEQVRNARQNPDILPQSVFVAVFYGFVFRLPSFQQLEAELAEPALQRWIQAPRGFRDDVLRYSLCSFDLDALQSILVHVNRQLTRQGL